MAEKRSTLPEHKKSLTEKEQEAIQRELDRDRASVGLPPEKPVEMSEAQKQYAEREKQQLLEAMQVPVPVKVAPEARDGKTQREQPAVGIATRRPTVVIVPIEAPKLVDPAVLPAAVSAVEEAKAAVEEAKQREAAAILAEQKARAEAEEAARDSQRADNRARLAPIQVKLDQLAIRVGELEQRYDRPLRDLARTITSSDDPRQREENMRKTNSAGPLREQLLRAMKAIQSARGALVKGSNSAESFMADRAMSEVGHALRFDTAIFAQQADALLAGHRATGGGYVTHEQWLANRVRGNPEPTVDTTWNR